MAIEINGRASASGTGASGAVEDGWDGLLASHSAALQELVASREALRERCDDALRRASDAEARAAAAEASRAEAERAGKPIRCPLSTVSKTAEVTLQRFVSLNSHNKSPFSQSCR